MTPAQTVDQPALNSPAQPLVSVIIPAYNVATHIGEALQSVFNQTWSSYEVIVINDGSSDTETLEEALGPHRNRICYLKQENRGAAAARNEGLRVAKGRYVAFLDADDFWLPQYLSEQVNFIEGSKADLVYADALLTRDSGISRGTYMEASPSQGEVTSVSLLSAKCNVITSGVLARRDVIIEVGMFDETIRRGHDFDLWFRLTKHGARLSYQRQVLLGYRISESGLSGDSEQQILRELTLLDILQRRGGLTPEEEDALKATLSRNKIGLALERGKAQLLKQHFSEAQKSFAEASAFSVNWKLRLALIGLRVAPRMLRHVYLWRTKARVGDK